MTHYETIQSKILNHESLPEKLKAWRESGKKIVFTNGCFDLLHLGHIDYLSKAADCGDVFIIGVNSDASVSKLKGEHRPIQDENSRSRILAALSFVTAVIVFTEETPYELIKIIQPDVLVKGADYKVEQIAGHDIVLEKGGEVILIDFLPGYSTSAIEKKIRKA